MRVKSNFQSKINSQNVWFWRFFFKKRKKTTLKNNIVNNNVFAKWVRNPDHLCA